MASLKDLFVVEAATFEAKMYFVDAEVKNKFVADFKPGAPREQEVKDGIPVWHVTVHIESYGALRISIPMNEKPDFPAFTPVAVENLRIGRSPKSYWGLADFIVASKEDI